MVNTSALFWAATSEYISCRKNELRNPLAKLLKNISLILTEGEKRNAFSLVLANLLVSLLDIFSLIILLFLIRFYSPEGAGNRISLLPSWLANRDSLAFILAFLVFFIGKSWAGFLVYQAQSRFVYRVASRISRGNLLKYLEGNYAGYVHQDSSVLVRRISQEPNEFCHYVLAGVQQIITETGLIALTISAILLYNARLFLFLFLILLPAVVGLSLFTKNRLRQVRAHIKTFGEKALQHLQEALSGFVESNLFGKNRFFTDRFVAYQERQNRFLADLVVTQGASTRVIEVFAVLGLFLLIAAAHWSGQSNGVGLITLGAFVAGAYKILPGVVKILNLSGQIKTYEFTLDDLLKDAQSPSRTAPGAEPVPIHAVSFRELAFFHGEHPILKGLSAEFHAGELVGFSGLSGKGKTTLINLLLGFLEPQQGEIRFNGAGVSAANRQAFWSRISYVKQSPFLLYDSIASNIALEDKEYDPERMLRAVQSSGLETLVHEYPGGLRKMITEGGKNISGGQRQRIALARAFYKEADFLILDEPFNELDKGAERELMVHIKKLAESGKIVLLVTHDPASLAYCHQIIALDA
jgi:ABC-type multidrug transport system fused ATPase/permease subunit